MNGYAPITVACETTGKTRNSILSMMKSGKVRFKETTSTTTRKPVLWVCLADITGIDKLRSLSFIKITSVQEAHSLSPRLVRYLINNGRLRWIQNGLGKLVCSEDVEQYATGLGGTSIKPKSSKR